MKVAVVGVTGLVGGVMLKVLEERNFTVDELIPCASPRSVGKFIQFKGRDYKVVSLQDGVSMKPDIALFSAGASVSKEWGPRFAEVGTFVIDNSSAWRMDPTIPLVVPEINAKILTGEDRLIANPNCSTIQLVAALNPIHKKYGIDRIIISTYQSFTGTGVKAVNQYNSERNGQKTNGEAAYPHPIFENCLPHCDIFYDNGYTKEELKLVNETRKILADDQLRITATAVRVPVDGGHSESVNVELKNPFTEEDIVSVLNETPGIVVQNNSAQNEYPMPLFAKDKDEVFVGRIRRDYSAEKALNMWIVADNLRKGAATNAIQIAEYLIKSELVRTSITS
jgi:aspartate-semialdehyde dehydrogenase